MEPADVPGIERLLMQSPEAAQWSRAVFLRDSAGASCQWVAEQGVEIVGMVTARAAGGEAEILNLAVLPRHRRSGVGRSLLECAISHMRAAGAESVFLEVREANAAARAFYARMGFVDAGRRRAYYRDPVEDALVLLLALKSG
jgi:ribosomal-protein-alanine N-acetyltransferase